MDNMVNNITITWKEEIATKTTRTRFRNSTRSSPVHKQGTKGVQIGELKIVVKTHLFHLYCLIPEVLLAEGNCLFDVRSIFQTKCREAILGEHHTDQVPATPPHDNYYAPL